MPSSKDYDSPVRTRRETADSKAETTRRIAREISQTEAEERDAKTARLKAARLNAAGLAQPERQSVAPADTAEQ